MKVTITAIELLSVQTAAKRLKSHFDSLVSTSKSAKGGGGNRGYGYSDTHRTLANPTFNLEKYKTYSKQLEKEMRVLRATITQHNARTTVTFIDPEGETETVSLFEALNRVADLERELSSRHQEMNSSLSIVAHRDDIAHSLDPWEDVPSSLYYLDVLESILELKRAIATANNKKVSFELDEEDSILLELMRLPE